MTRCMFLILAAAVSATAADGVIRRLVWQVETSDPVERHWALTYGETVDFEVQYLDHRRPMDLAGGSVVLHARTNGMDTGLSYQATGSVMSAQGWATVRVAVDDLLPAGLTAASYRIAVTKGGSTNLLAAAGTFRLTGSGAGLAGAALPTPVAMEIRAEMAAATNQVMALLGPRITTLESWTNNWSAAFSWGPHFAAGYLLPSDIAGLATTQQVAQAAAAIPRDRIITVDGSQWIDATGGVWRVSYGGEGYWTISILGTLYGSATNAYYEVRSAPFDFWAYDQAFWDGDAYFRWYPDGDPGHGHVYVEVQGVEETHDYNYPTNDLADGVFEFYTSATYTHFVLAWSNDLSSVSTQRVDGLAWQSDLSPYATTQQVAAALAPMATTQHVAEAVAAIPPEDLTGRTATNLAVSGWLALPQSQPTNLIMRLVASNDVIMAIGVIQ